MGETVGEGVPEVDGVGLGEAVAAGAGKAAAPLYACGAVHRNALTAMLMVRSVGSDDDPAVSCTEAT